MRQYASFLSFSALALLLGLGCGKAAVAPAKMSEGSKPAATLNGAASSAAYPKTPTRPPPVPLPAGQGASVPLQRYIALDQFGYRPEMTKIAVLVDPEQGWNA